MRAAVPHSSLLSVLFSLYGNNITTPCRHVELALYAEDGSLISTSRNPWLLVGYLEFCLCRLDFWLRDWRIATNVSKSTAVFFVMAARRKQKPRPLQTTRKVSQYNGSQQQISWGDP
jgi:hypothetical protein